MATIILNGVATDTNPLSATEQNDKLTVSGGLNNYEADMLGGKDLVQIDQAGEDVSSTVIKGGDNNDVLLVGNSGYFATESDITLSGGDGSDIIEFGGFFSDRRPTGSAVTDFAIVDAGMSTLTGKVNGNDGDDTIEVVRADSSTVQGGPGNDRIFLGSITELDVAGSRADSTVDNSSVNGGKGNDVIDIL